MEQPANRPKKWSANEDEFLLTMNRRACTLKDMAARFNVTEFEIEQRLEFIAAMRDAEREREAQAKKKEFEAAPAIKMDAITLIGTKLVRGYDIMGQDLQRLVELVTSPVDEVELATVLRVYLKAVGVAAEVSVDAEHMAAKLVQHFVIIPRVMLQVAPAQPSNPPPNDATTQHQDLRTHADAPGNLPGEKGPGSN